MVFVDCIYFYCQYYLYYWDPISVWWWTLLPKYKSLRLDCKIKCVVSLCTNELLIIKLGWSWSLKVVSILDVIVGDMVIGNLIVEGIVWAYSVSGVVIVNVYSDGATSVGAVNADIGGVAIGICDPWINGPICAI